jgi:hypothetical protein
MSDPCCPTCHHPLHQEPCAAAPADIGRDAQRYRFIVAQYARSRDLHMDGTRRWYLNSPYLGRTPATTFDEAIDNAMREQRTLALEENL